MLIRLARLGAVAAVTVLAVFAVACGGDNDDGSTSAASAPTSAPATSPTASAAATVNMTITGFVYAPGTLTAKPGQKVTVTVRNNDSAPHTFTIDGIVDSGNLAKDESKTIEFTPSQAGTLSFYCKVHGAQRMSGTLTVSTSASSAPGSGGSSGGGTGTTTSSGDGY